MNDERLSMAIGRALGTVAPVAAPERLRARVAAISQPVSRRTGLRPLGRRLGRAAPLLAAGLMLAVAGAALSWRFGPAAGPAAVPSQSGAGQPTIAMPAGGALRLAIPTRPAEVGDSCWDLSTRMVEIGHAGLSLTFVAPAGEAIYPIEPDEFSAWLIDGRAELVSNDGRFFVWEGLGGERKVDAEPKFVICVLPPGSAGS
jgi:hypothetical protein